MTLTESTTGLVEIRGVHKSYGGVEVLRGIDLTIAPGEVVAIDIAGATTRVLPGPVEYPALPGRIERVETTAADGTNLLPDPGV